MQNKSWEQYWPALASAMGMLGAALATAAAEERSTIGGIGEVFQVDKSRYHLFNPTPVELMREMITDRPDRTEGPYTVDAGHFQLEMDVLNYTYDRYNTARDAARAETVAITPMNLKAGLLHNVDFHLGLQTYSSVRIRDAVTGKVQTRRGFGDLIPRLKINLWGNDGGNSAFAMLPFLKLPTNQDHLGNNSLEGGLIFPLAAKLPYAWEMGMMTQFNFTRDDDGNGHHPEFIHSITFGHDIAGKLAGYAEFFTAVSTESGSDWVGTFDVGFTYGLTKDIQLDAGVNIGVTRSADDINPFLGISFRF